MSDDGDPVLQRAVAFELIRALFKTFQTPDKDPALQRLGVKLKAYCSASMELAIKAETDAEEVLGFNPNPYSKVN